MTARSSSIDVVRPERSEGDRERALADAASSWAVAFGTGSRLELREALARLVELAPRPCGEPAGGFAALRAGVEREHIARYGARRLAAEAEDERLRDAAVVDDDMLASYERRWARRLVRLQRAHPDRWQLPGLSHEELRDELTLRLMIAIRTMPDELARHHRAGKEWGLVFMAEQRRLLRKTFRLEVVLTDPSPGFDQAPSGEERLIALQSEHRLATARQQAEATLTRPQRRWFAAMRMTANAGAFFESSGRLNLAAAGRVLDRNRSSAHRAFGELQRRFMDELDKLGH